jgi:CRP-like cAMP-binding protein
LKKNQALKEIKVKKGQILQHNGELNSKIYFVKSGLLRSYSIDKKGKEHIFMFGPENWTIADSINPELQGLFAKNNKLADTKHLLVDIGKGP